MRRKSKNLKKKNKKFFEESQNIEVEEGREEKREGSLVDELAQKIEEEKLW